MFEYASAVLSTFALISLAEIGDKSQLVCMALAARHRHWPVLLGACLAFSLLNALAVLFGAGIAAWLPERLTLTLVAVLFGVFAAHMLRGQPRDPAESLVEPSGRNLFFTTLGLIVIAEFGDKTQLAVAALAGTVNAQAVWLGATLALATVSALGVWAGRTLLQRMPVLWLHRLSGGLFAAFALFAGWQALVAGHG